MAQHYRDLLAWQKGMDLVEAVYRVTQKFPADERFGLTNQLRRAAVSIPSNIAEGQGRKLRKQFVLFLRIARGSVQEIETQLLISQRLNYAVEAEIIPVLATCNEASKILAGLIRSMEVG